MLVVCLNMLCCYYEHSRTLYKTLFHEVTVTHTTRMKTFKKAIVCCLEVLKSMGEVKNLEGEEEEFDDDDEWEEEEEE